MITKEAIEAGVEAGMKSSGCGVMLGDERVTCDDPRLGDRAEVDCVCRRDFTYALTAALAAMPATAGRDLALPQDVIDSLLAIGHVEWGVSLTQPDEKHAADLVDTLRLTREHFGTPDEETGIHGVYLSGTGVVLAHTGMSPNSPQHARILTGAWNMLVDHANSAPTTPAHSIASENEAGKHQDDRAVDRFAAAMKAKLAQKRAEGRGGWDNPDECSIEWLSELLRSHVEKADPVDVGNLAMMIHQRGERICK